MNRQQSQAGYDEGGEIRTPKQTHILVAVVILVILVD